MTMKSRTIIHYVGSWLPISQQFVHRQITSSKYGSVVVTRDEPYNRIAFPHPKLVRITETGFPPRVGRVISRTATLLRVAFTHRAALFHLHFGYAARDVELFVRLTRLPFVVSLHGHDATGLVVENPGYYGTALRRANVVIVPSTFLAKRAVAIGVDPDRIRTIAAGVDTQLFSPTPIETSPTILFVGRLVEKKGIDVLMQAWPSVLGRVPDARLLVLGDGPLREVVKGPRVTLITPDADKPRHQVAELIRGARVVVSPSKTAINGDSESCLLVNLEAMASGRPVVSTWHGGIPEFVIDGETGILVPEGDALALAQALYHLGTDLDAAQQLGRAGSRHAAKYDATLAASAVDTLYDELLVRRPLAGASL